MAIENKNFFKVPNEYKDTLCNIRIPGEARQILDVIERLTLGWNKKETAISFKTFRKMTKMDNRHIVRAREKLIEMRIITIAKKGNREEIYYRIQMDYENWKPLPKKARGKNKDASLPKKATKTIAKLGNKSLPNWGTTTSVTKDINVKDSIYKDRENDIPPQLLKEKLKELKEDLRKEKIPGELDYIREGIKGIKDQLKKAGMQ